MLAHIQHSISLSKLEIAKTTCCISDKWFILFLDAKDINIYKWNPDIKNWAFNCTYRDLYRIYPVLLYSQEFIVQYEVTLECESWNLLKMETELKFLYGIHRILQL